MGKRNTYYNTTFTGFYPVGTAAVIRAENKDVAAGILTEMLRLKGLPQKIKPEDMIIFSGVGLILCDGNY